MSEYFFSAGYWKCLIILSNEHMLNTTLYIPGFNSLLFSFLWSDAVCKKLCGSLTQNPQIINVLSPIYNTKSKGWETMRGMCPRSNSRTTLTRRMVPGLLNIKSVSKTLQMGNPYLHLVSTSEFIFKQISFLMWSMIRAEWTISSWLSERNPQDHFDQLESRRQRRTSIMEQDHS